MKPDMIQDVVNIAALNGIPAPALLAVVEIESGGQPFEPDGETPRFLFERHVFHRALRKRAPHLLAQAEAAGLAVPNWSRANYADMRSSADRLRILQRAMDIDTECANIACSWGLGQILGENAGGLRYGSATEMRRHFSAAEGGRPAQIDGMMRFIESKNLTRHLRNGAWTPFAIGYNGKRQAEHNYDGRLARAQAKWSGSALPAPGQVRPVLVASGRVALASGDTGANVTALQTRLHALRYPVGTIDGIYGPMTEAAIFAFQSANGLNPNGTADPATIALLEGAGRAMPVSDARRSATEQDLLAKGSPLIRETEFGKKISLALGGLGGVGLFESLFGGKPVTSPSTEGPLGFLLKMATTMSGDNGGALVTLAKAVPVLLGPGHGLPIIAAGAGLMLFRSFGKVAAQRRLDHAQGQNLGR
jgi:hypothetical protein